MYLLVILTVEPSHDGGSHVGMTHSHLKRATLGMWLRILWKVRALIKLQKIATCVHRQCNGVGWSGGMLTFGRARSSAEKCLVVSDSWQLVPHGTHGRFADPCFHSRLRLKPRHSITLQWYANLQNWMCRILNDILNIENIASDSH